MTRSGIEGRTKKQTDYQSPVTHMMRQADAIELGKVFLMREGMEEKDGSSTPFTGLHGNTSLTSHPDTNVSKSVRHYLTSA